MYNLLKREITTEFGTEIVIEKRHKLFKDQYKDRLWVMQPRDPRFVALNNKMIQKGLWI